MPFRNLGHRLRDVPGRPLPPVLSPDRMSLPLHRQTGPVVRFRLRRRSVTGHPGILASLLHPMAVPTTSTRPMPRPVSADVAQPVKPIAESRDWQGHQYMAASEAGQQAIVITLSQMGMIDVDPGASYRGVSLPDGRTKAVISGGNGEIGLWVDDQAASGMAIIVAEGEQPLSSDVMSVSGGGGADGLVIATRDIRVAEAVAGPDSDGVVLIEPAAGWTEAEEKAGPPYLLYAGIGLAAAAGLYLVVGRK